MTDPGSCAESPGDRAEPPDRRDALLDWQPDDERAAPDAVARRGCTGRTNLCHNAVDRHLATRRAQAALIHVSTATGTEKSITYAQLFREVNRCAGMLRGLGVGCGDPVMIHLPAIPEAAIAWLASVRLGAVPWLAGGELTAEELAARIDALRPAVALSTDGGACGGRLLPYRAVLDAALGQSRRPPAQVLRVARGLGGAADSSGRDAIYAALRARHMNDEIACTWVDSDAPSQIAVTAGAGAAARIVRHDTGGHASRLVAAMRDTYDGRAADTFFAVREIGAPGAADLVFGGPLLAGMTAILFEGSALVPDPAICWQIVARHRVNLMVAAAAQIRALLPAHPAPAPQHALPTLRRLFLAGAPRDAPTARWAGERLARPIAFADWTIGDGTPRATCSA